MTELTPLAKVTMINMVDASRERAYGTQSPDLNLTPPNSISTATHDTQLGLRTLAQDTMQNIASESLIAPWQSMDTQSVRVIRWLSDIELLPRGRG